ncbi:hypothetical protein BX666DRAFT_1911647 [Dichotomocladium elegans]|nr:hypothetical protein BX666DRAFT_1911647 [Dichotomocladium elegans]
MDAQEILILHLLLTFLNSFSPKLISFPPPQTMTPALSVDQCNTKQPPPVAKNKKTECLLQPTRFWFKHSEFEYSVYSPSKRFLRDLETVYPNLTAQQREEMLVVPVIQHCTYDLVGMTPDVNAERDEKLELFMQWGSRIIKRLTSLGMWADLTDPTSGFPLVSAPGPSPYPDVHCTHELTRYDLQNVGCCHILLHPTWKSHIYPATFFTTAPLDILVRVIEEQTELAKTESC